MVEAPTNVTSYNLLRRQVDQRAILSSFVLTFALCASESSA